MDKRNGEKCTPKKVVADCSFGIGYNSIQKFNEYTKDYIQLKVINKPNDNPENLNKDCGAEFVHKQCKIPKNFPLDH